MYRKKTALAMAIATSVVMVFGSTFASASSAVLKKESRGSEVTALQNDLKRLGYLSEEATGYFGNATEAAVRKVQQEYGYEADGIAGQVTLSLVDRLRGRSSSTAAKPTASKTTASKTTAATVSNTSKTANTSNAITAKLLKEGDENSSVKALQQQLIKLGYLDTKATGFYGPATVSAVKKLQKKYGYKADGITGSGTLTLLSKLASGKTESTASKATASKAASTEAKTATPAATETTATAAANTDISTPAAVTAANTDTTTPAAVSAANTDAAAPAAETAAKTTQTDFMPKWYGDVEKTFARGDTATVYDIETGLSFKIKRTYGTNHADCETLTAKDTAIMKKIYNGTWSWERRAIIVMVDDLKIAACMTGLPHAGTDKYAANKTVASRSGGYGRGTNLDAVKKNDMNGVFDIHFLGSKNHYNNKVDPKHQAKIKEAAKWAEENYK